jgi:N-acetylglucosamine-6-phosphate deacetylase
MSSRALFARRALTPLLEIPDVAIIIEDGRITAIGPRDSTDVPRGARRVEAQDSTVVPGFVDVHVHGAGGHDVMEGSAAALDAVSATLALGGTTSFLATTVTAAPDRLCQSAEGISTYIRGQINRTESASPRAEILGIHFEGPFISAARRGVHPAEWIAAPSLSLLRRMLDGANGSARILTLAPEIPGALDLIDAARKEGIVVALGHTDATYAQAMAGIAYGASHAAHVYNAMRPFTHRDTGILGAVLTSPNVTGELIADGVHVDDAAMKLLMKAKGAGGVILVSDGTAGTGMPDGRYRLGELDVDVKDGVVRNAEGKLAGSALTLDRALRNVVALGVPLQDAVAMLTLYPARLLGLEGRKGSLVSGADADLVLLDGDLRISRVVTRGTGLD